MALLSLSAWFFLVLSLTSFAGVLGQKNVVYVEPPYLMNLRLLTPEVVWFDFDCDYSSFRNINLPPDAYAEWIALSRKQENKNEEIIASFPPKEVNLIGGQENHIITYGKPGIFKDSGLSISGRIFGRNCMHAGAYKCMIKIRGMGTLVNTTTSHLIAHPPFYEKDPNGCKGKKVVQPLPQEVDFNVKEQVRVLCNNSRFWDVYVPPKENIDHLTIVRQLENAEIVEIASYLPKASQKSQLVVRESQGTNVDFKKGGNGGTIENGAIFLEMIVNGAKCQDAGTYRCMLTTAENSITPIYSNKFYIDYNTKEISRPKLKVTPKEHGDEKTAYIERGEEVTVECSFTGPRKMQFQWTTSGRVDVLPPEQIKDSQGCPTYYHRSVNKFIHDYNNSYIVCRAENGQQSVAETTMNLLFSRAPPRILSVDRVFTKFNYSVSCDASHFLSRRFPANSYVVAMGMLYKPMFADDFNTLAMYRPFESGAEKAVVNKPAGRDWIFQTSGGESNSNVRTIKTVLHIKDGNCEDWGWYKCIAKTNLDTDYFYSDKEVISKKSQTSPQDKLNCFEYDEWEWLYGHSYSQNGAMAIYGKLVSLTPWPMVVIVYTLLF